MQPIKTFWIQLLITSSIVTPCCARTFIVENQLNVPIYCDLDSTTKGCDFHFDTEYEGSIPAGKTIKNDTTIKCDLACYMNVKFKVVGSNILIHLKLILPICTSSAMT